jgi:hypothetical protein
MLKPNSFNKILLKTLFILMYLHYLILLFLILF